MTRRAALAAALVLPVLAGCGGRGTSPATTRAASTGTPVTSTQTLVLARLLQRNYDLRGARISGTIPVRGEDVPITGRVDFRTGRGSFSAAQPGAAPRRYVWTRTRVFAQSRPGSSVYDAEAPAPRTDPVHSAIAFVNLLSAETIDNTANLVDQDARFLRHDRLAAEAVDVYRLGANGSTTYWVDRRTGLLAQVRADLGTGTAITIRLGRRGPERIALPSTSS